MSAPSRPWFSALVPVWICTFASCGEEARGRAGGGARGEDTGFFTSDSGSSDAGSLTTDSGAQSGADSGVVSDVMIMVASVADGDTVRLSASPNAKAPDGTPLNGKSVRLLGVDAPEIAHPPDPAPAECWGDEARVAARELMQGRVVSLDYDSARELWDPYQRLLAYVLLEDGRVANEVLIRSGNALSYKNRHRDRAKYDQLAAEAKAQKLGVWTCP